jgi:hypothetical protein
LLPAANHNSSRLDGAGQSTTGFQIGWIDFEILLRWSRATANIVRSSTATPHWKWTTATSRLLGFWSSTSLLR